MVYCKTVGRTRVENIASILEELGLTVTIKKPENDDVDMWVYNQEELVLVVESLNWRRDLYLYFGRVISIRDNFSNPDYNNSRKLLVFSFKKSIKNQMRYFEDLNVDFLEIGFQTQPVFFYLFFRSQGKASGMKPYTHITREIVKSKLTAYLREVNLM